MKVQSVGPFQVSTSLELPDLESEAGNIQESSKLTSEVGPDAEAGDSTQDEENRGFVHILDAIEKERLKKRGKRARAKDFLYSKSASPKRAAFKYLSLDDTETSLQSKGSNISKAA